MPQSLRSTLAALLLLVVPAFAEAPAKVEAPLDLELDLKQIMAHPDWLGNPPEDPYWGDDGRSIYYRQQRQGEERQDLFRLELATGVTAAVAPAELGMIDVGDGTLSRDRRRKVYSRAGDLFVKDLPTGKIHQLTRTTGMERQPAFMADSERIFFRRGKAVFVRDLESGLESQPAEILLEDDPAENDRAEGFLAEQQTRLLEVIRETRRKRHAQRQHERLEQEQDHTRPPLPWYFGDKVEVEQSSLSPRGDRMLVVLADAERKQGKMAEMPEFVTESGYVETREIRTKVGTGDESSERLVLLDLNTHQKHELDLSSLPRISEDPLRDLRRAAAERKKAEQSPQEASASKQDTDKANKDAEKEEKKGKRGKKGEKEERGEEAEPRPVEIELLRWSPDGSQAAVQLHSLDNKDRWLAVIRDGGSTLEPVHHLRDEAWINWRYNDFGWLRDGTSLWYLSEESGYSQLYTYSSATRQHQRLTLGEFVVSDVQADPEERFFYFTANVDHPGIYDIYRVPVTGGEMEQLTRLGGLTSAVLSPDGTQLLIEHSTTTHPPELYLQPAKPGAEARRLTHTASDAFTAIDWTAPSIEAVPSTHHSRPIYSRLYLPPASAPPPAADGRRPAVIFVHGAGYLQNSHQGWSGYFREFMFHTLLTRLGYVVLDMDYRASAGYGRDWRTAIYRQMGTPELEDLQDGVSWLHAEHGVDRERVGVYGGSYGGFMTFMSMFLDPDLFACGAALRPVTDWAHYNHGYTSNILNTPEIDPEAYERSSPIEFAQGLERPLLICAPMVDDNVHFQDTVRLVQKLIELEKENWEVALYPVEPHGFREPSSWLDEYRRILKLFEEHLEARD